MSDETNPRRTATSRRRFLGVAGASAITLSTAGIGNASAVQSSQSNSSDLNRVQVAFGTVDAPVSESTQKTLRDRAAKAYRQDAGEAPQQAARVQPSGDTSLIGFAVGFDNRGVPRYMTAKTSNPEQVDAQQQQLQERVEGLQGQIQSTTLVGKNAETAANPHWQFEVGIYAGGGADSDAGSISNDITVYHLDDDGVSDGEVFAAVQILGMQPEAYDNLDGDCHQDWSPAGNSPGVQSSALTDYAPDDSVSGGGTKTRSISARGVSKSFSWTHDGDCTTYSETSSEDADSLFGDFTQSYYDGGREQELGCASAVETNQPSDGYHEILTAKASGTFYYARHQVYDEVEITDTQDISVNYEFL